MTDSGAAQRRHPDMNCDSTDRTGAMTEAALLRLLDELGVPHQIYRHPPLHTVEESRALRGQMPGAHVKNMFLKGKKGDLWLVTCLEERVLRIPHLQKAIGASRLSFGKAELMHALLGVAPGSVTPLAVVNDSDRQVSIVLDAALCDADIVNCHPLHNEATVRLDGRISDGEGLAKLFAYTGHEPMLADFDALARQAATEQGAQSG